MAKPRSKTKKAWADIHIRCLDDEKNRLQMLAETYAAGNLSAWLIFAGLNCPRKHLTVKELLRK